MIVAYFKWIWINIKMLFGSYTPKYKVGDEIVRLVMAQEPWEQNVAYLMKIDKIGKIHYLVNSDHGGIALSIALVDILCKRKEEALPSITKKFSVVNGGKTNDNFDDGNNTPSGFDN